MDQQQQQAAWTGLLRFFHRLQRFRMGMARCLYMAVGMPEHNPWPIEEQLQAMGLTVAALRQVLTQAGREAQAQAQVRPRRSPPLDEEFLNWAIALPLPVGVLGERPGPPQPEEQLPRHPYYQHRYLEIQQRPRRDQRRGDAQPIAQQHQQQDLPQDRGEADVAAAGPVLQPVVPAVREPGHAAHILPFHTGFTWRRQALRGVVNEDERVGWRYPPQAWMTPENPPASWGLGSQSLVTAQPGSYGVLLDMARLYLTQVEANPDIPEDVDTLRYLDVLRALNIVLSAQYYPPEDRQDFYPPPDIARTLICQTLHYLTLRALGGWNRLRRECLGLQQLQPQDNAVMTPQEHRLLSLIRPYQGRQIANTNVTSLHSLISLFRIASWLEQHGQVVEERDVVTEFQQMFPDTGRILLCTVRYVLHGDHSDPAAPFEPPPESRNITQQQLERFLDLAQRFYRFFHGEELPNWARTPMLVTAQQIQYQEVEEAARRNLRQ